MSDRVLLTEKREQVLNGEYEGSNDALRNQKSRLRQSARTALDELIQVAASPEIENAEVFEPNEVARLLDALMVPRGTGLTPRWNFEGDPAEYRDTYRYQLALHGRIDHSLDGYGEMLHRDHKPGETVNVFGDVIDE